VRGWKPTRFSRPSDPPGQPARLFVTHVKDRPRAVFLLCAATAPVAFCGAMSR